MGPRPHLWICACRTAYLLPELIVSMGPSPHVWFLDAKQKPLGQNNKSLWVPALNCGFCMQYSDFWTRITSLCGSQTSPVVLCMQYSVISTGMTSLHGFQPSSVVFACNTAIFGPELQVSMGPRPHLSFCARNTASVPPEWLVYMGSSPHLWFLHAIQPLLDQNNKSLSVPDMTCPFVHAKQRE